MRRQKVAAVMVAAGLLAVFSLPHQASARTKTLRSVSTTMSGLNEVPPADADGTGNGDFTVTKKRRVGKPAIYKVCWSLVDWSNLDAQADQGHIHFGATGVNGGIAVTLFEGPRGNSTPPASGSVGPQCTRVKKSIAKAIVANPGNFYCNIHTSAHRSGAIRGQLT